MRPDITGNYWVLYTFLRQFFSSIPQLPPLSFSPAVIDLSRPLSAFKQLLFPSTPFSFSTPALIYLPRLYHRLEQPLWPSPFPINAAFRLIRAPVCPFRSLLKVQSNMLNVAVLHGALISLMLCNFLLFCSNEKFRMILLQYRSDAVCLCRVFDILIWGLQNALGISV